jgi:hypothetical protein
MTPPRNGLHRLCHHGLIECIPHTHRHGSWPKQEAAWLAHAAVTLGNMSAYESVHGFNEARKRDMPGRGRLTPPARPVTLPRKTAPSIQCTANQSEQGLDRRGDGDLRPQPAAGRQPAPVEDQAGQLHQHTGPPRRRAGLAHPTAGVADADGAVLAAVGVGAWCRSGMIAVSGWRAPPSGRAHDGCQQRLTRGTSWNETRSIRRATSPSRTRLSQSTDTSTARSSR